SSAPRSRSSTHFQTSGSVWSCASSACSRRVHRNSASSRLTSTMSQSSGCGAEPGMRVELERHFLRVVEDDVVEVLADQEVAQSLVHQDGVSRLGQAEDERVVGL